MNTSRYKHSICYSKDRVFVIGGRQTEDGDRDTSISKCEYYDCKTNKWVNIASCFYPAHRSAVCVYEDMHLYKIGGTCQAGQQQSYLKFIERYNIAADRWEQINPSSLSFLTHFSNTECVILNSKQLLIFGGGLKFDSVTAGDLSIVVKIQQESQVDILCNDDLLEMDEADVYQMPFVCYPSNHRNVVIHDEILYYLTSSQRVLTFNGYTWSVLL